MTDLLNGRIPPNALEFESLVIGVCLIDVRGLNHVKKVFRDNYQVFYDPRHQEIYRAIDYLSSKNRHCGESDLVIGWNAEYQKFHDLGEYEIYEEPEKLPQISAADAFGTDEPLPF